MRSCLITVTLLLCGCRGEAAARTFGASDWRCQIPERLNGPIDEALPASGGVEHVRVCAGTSGRVAVVWLRAIETSRAREDGPRHMRPISDPPHGHTTEQARKSSSEVGISLTDSLLGMGVVDSSGVEIVQFAKGVDATSGFRADLLGSVIFADGAWRTAIALCLWNDSGGPCDPLVRIMSFDEHGWLPSERDITPSGTPTGGVRLFDRGAGFDLFWLEYYWPPGSLPDFMGGTQQLRLNYTSLPRGGLGVTKAICDLPGRVHARQAWLVSPSPGRYDLVFARMPDMKQQGTLASADLMHVPRLLSDRTPGPTKLGTCCPNCSNELLTLWSGGIEALWLEESSRRLSPPGVSPCQLVEARLEGQKWSKPRPLFQGTGWDYASLAAASMQVDGAEVVVAVWRGQEGHLTYSSSGDRDKWAEPTAVQLQIGRLNWLVACEQRLALVTVMQGNLYWCFIDLSHAHP